jgi:acetyl-CoA acetyltransferase
VALAIGFEGGRHATRLDIGGGDDVEAMILPAAHFAMWANRRMYERGTSVETLAQIAAKNWNHARHCSWAQRQADHQVTASEILSSRVIVPPHTSMMSAAVGSGAAAVVLMSAERARSKGLQLPHVRVLASVLQTERYTDGHVFLGPVVGPPQMTRDAATAAYEQAGLGPSDLDLVQVHDAFPIEELEYYELLGLCGDGEGEQMVADGDTALGGRVPFSTDGGLIGRGHPGGPTGLAQVHETVQQLQGRSGLRQVEGATVGLCHMVGAGSSCVVSILAR